MPLITKGKTNYLYVLFVAVLAVIAGGLILGYYYFWIIELEARLIEIEAQLPMVKAPKDETANWKVYKNSDFGYQISYPNSWLLKEDEVETGLLGTEIKKVKMPSFLFSQNKDVSVDVSVTILEEDEALEETITEGIKPHIVNKSNLTFQGLPALRYDVEGATESLQTGLPLSYTSIAFKKDKILYEITSFGPSAAKEDSLKVFNQMLLTFKFIEEFCGSSTFGSCVSDSDCVTGGCSGQVCQSKNEEPVITTCEWKDCYDKTKYNLECKCAENKCQWSK